MSLNLAYNTPPDGIITARRTKSAPEPTLAERIERINKDTRRVAMEMTSWSQARKYEDVPHYCEVATLAENAWPAIEALANGDRLTLDQQATLPALYQALRTFASDRRWAVARAAERDARYERGGQ